MKTASVGIQEITSSYQHRIKPNSYLLDGKRLFIVLEKNNAIDGAIGDVVKEVYRPGIFKRVFVDKREFGLPYITAQAMMTENPLLFSKLLSKRMTKDLEPMILERNSILVSCAGSIGNVRLIDKFMMNNIGSQDIIRVVANDNYGFIYAYLSSNSVYSYLQSQLYGSVVPRIEPETIQNIPLVKISSHKKSEINELIKTTVALREEAGTILYEVQKELKQYAGLPDLTIDDYDYYGVSTKGREPSVFIKNKKDITSTTINAFNHSLRISNLKAKLSKPYLLLRETLINGDFFTTGSFTRKEAPEGKGVMLINQSDIFDFNIKGKNIYKKCLKNVKLLDYGEVLIAGVGTLGENETFCRCVFANESLQGQLVSGEFLRMKTIDTIPSGYLFAWLSSDYGFRLIRSTQSGTKQCRPIQKLLLDIPVPLLTKEEMQSIDEKVRTAHTLQYKATVNENKAITMVEEEIEKWQSPTA